MCTDGSQDKFLAWGDPGYCDITKSCPRVVWESSLSVIYFDGHVNTSGYKGNQSFVLQRPALSQ